MDGLAPIESAQSFDNVGLLIGKLNSRVETVLIALDLTRQVLQQAKTLKAQAIVTHHPIIFKPVKLILADDLLFEVVNSGVNVIAMHTNLDCAKKGVSFCLAKALKLKNIEILVGSDNFGRVGVLENKLHYDKFLELVSNRLNSVVKATKIDGFVEKVAVVSGAGGFALKAAICGGVDALVTGECRHSDFVEASNKYFGLVAAGHFETEVVFCEPLKKQLEQAFGSVNFFVADSFAPAGCFYGKLEGGSKWL